MKSITKIILPLLFAIPAVSAVALPDLVTVYARDPFAKIKNGDCTLCHEVHFRRTETPLVTPSETTFMRSLPCFGRSFRITSPFRA